MKIKYLLTFLLGGFFIIIFSSPVMAEECTTSSDWGYLEINEVYYAESNDWVELYNTKNDKCIDVTGLFFHDSSSVISGSYNTVTKIINPASWWVGQLSNRLNKGADKIFFSDTISATTTVWDIFEYNEEVSSNTFWARIPDGTGSWAKTVSGTPGLANILVNTEVASSTTPIILPTTTLSTTLTAISMDNSLWQYLRLNEVVSNPLTGNEAIEIYNPTTSSIDLNGGYICDNRESTSTCKILSGIINAYQFLWWDLDTQSYLNNDGDSVRLFDPDDDVVDQMNYDDVSAPDEGESMARNIDGAGQWVVTTNITPGAENEIVVRPQSNSVSGGGSTNDVKGYTTNTTSSVSSTAKVAKETKKEVKIVWKVNTPTQGEPGELLKFSAGLSADPRGGEVLFGWDFGDNKIMYGKEVEYSFVTSSLYKIIISATSTASTTDKYQFNLKIGAGLKWNNTGIKISALLSDPLNTESQEYITILNASTSTVNMTGWQLHTVNADKSYLFPEGTIITPSSTLTFYRLATKLTLNNEGEELELLNIGQGIVDQVKYVKSKKGEVQNFVSTSVTSTALGSIVIVAKPKAVIATKKSTSYTSYSNTTISEAREKTKNSGAIVNGIVAAAPKTFGVQYFYIVDEFNGIQIYNFKKLFPNLKIGDRVTVKGSVTEASGQKRIKTNSNKDIDILSTANKLNARSVELSDIGEDTAGALVQVTGDITEIKTSFMYLDDGEGELVVYFKKGAQIDKKKFKEGNKVTVTGLVEITKGVWQLWPRNDADIVVVGAAPEILAKTTPAVPNSTGTYVSAALGAATTMLLGLLARARGAMFLVMGKKAATIAVRLIKRG